MCYGTQSLAKDPASAGTLCAQQPRSTVECKFVVDMFDFIAEIIALKNIIQKKTSINFIFFPIN